MGGTSGSTTPNNNRVQATGQNLNNEDNKEVASASTTSFSAQQNGLAHQRGSTPCLNNNKTSMG